MRLAASDEYHLSHTVDPGRKDAVTVAGGLAYGIRHKSIPATGAGGCN